MFHQNYFRLKVVMNKEQLEYLVAEFKKSSKVFWDTETSGLEVRAKGKDYLVGYAFMFDTNIEEAFYIPVRHSFEGEFLPQDRFKGIIGKEGYFPSFFPEKFSGSWKNIDCDLDILKELFENGGKELIAHNISFDLHVLATEGFNINKIFENNILFDTQLAVHSIDEEQEKKLEKVTEKIFGIKKADYRDVVATVSAEEKKSVGLKANNKAPFPLVQIPIAGQYSTEDVFFMRQMYPQLVEAMIKEKSYDYFTNYRIPFLKSLYNVERRGVKIDLEARQEMEKKAEETLDEITYRIYEIAGQEFNIGSGQQLSEIIFGFKKKLKDKKEGGYKESFNESLVNANFGFKPITFTEGGKTEDINLKTPQTSTDVLEELLLQKPKRKDGKEFIELLLKYSKLNKIYTAFIKGLKETCYGGGRVKPNFNQTGTQTYRLSCSSPNLQQLPKPLDVPDSPNDYYDFWSQFEVRRLIVADNDECLIVAADYSNLEKRITAHFSKDEALQRMFAENLDSHGLVATMLFEELKNVHPNEVKKVNNALRNIAKTVSFAMDYLGTAYTVAKSLGVAKEEAQKLIDNYFKGFKGLHKYTQDVIKLARNQGYIETILGHKRHAYGINSGTYKLKSYYERAVVNAKCQGSAADIITLAQLDVDNDELLKSMDVKILIQVHDELVFQVPKKYVEVAMPRIKYLMENCLITRGIEMTPALIVNIDKGNNYAEAK